MYVPEGKMGKVWDSSKKEYSLENLRKSVKELRRARPATLREYDNRIKFLQKDMQL
jgi:hypothetical protein